MNKKVEFELTAGEKQILKEKKISQNMLRSYAPDKVAAMSMPCRGGKRIKDLS